MRQLLPVPVDDVTIEESYRTPAGQPWLRLSMVLSVDGAATDENGWTTDLAGEPDARMLRALRAVADAVIVGAGTVRTGKLGPIRTRRYLRAESEPETAQLVVVSGSLELDWALPVFTDTAPAIVVTSAAGATGELPAALRRELIIAGSGTVDLVSAVAQLRDRGYQRLLCEGGPRLAASVLESGVVDELCLTVAPAIMPADRLRGLAVGADRLPLTLTHVSEDSGVLFLRYRTRGTNP
jgi:5-amino-6-(5-phosphoribosylamino)uracil reductase